MKYLFLKKLSIVALMSSAFCAQADMLTSIKPLGFIASAIGQGVTPTQVLLPPGASPHEYQLKPSQRLEINKADLFIWIGPDMEAFLTSTVDNLPAKKVITLSKTPGLQSLLVESYHQHGVIKDKLVDEHDHTNDHADEHAENDLETNWHLWLSPEISEKMAAYIAQRLEVVYPDKKSVIQENLKNFDLAVNQKIVELKKQLMSLKDKGYYVYHDGYTYFERKFALDHLGAFTVNPAIPPGAKTLSEIIDNANKQHAVCVLTEPEFTPRVIDKVLKATSMKIGYIDPLGVSTKMGANAYPQFLQTLADSFTSCLSNK